MIDTWLHELRTKPLLRLALLAAVALAWIYALLELEAGVGKARTDQARLQVELERMQALAEDTSWPAQRERVFRQLADLRARAWREESEGLMQALMQDWLRDQLAGQGLQPRELTVAVLPAGDAAEPDLRLVRSRVVFDFSAETLHALLAEFARHPNALWVPRLVVRNAQQRVVELDVEALFLVGTRSGGTP